ncbi:Hypothetical protein, putative [Bodo saltans]|uniref:Uncharacterized protein n=1 Tax=Bodo saltans TaxID=75058 RepID=A0A0S4JBS6_BODSA|nr:Hypothetical protein, putative [Bodo saltans]|eukprot:CUG85424.1 Hypothetical protein, putative [Bodo saltans]
MSRWDKLYEDGKRHKTHIAKLVNDHSQQKLLKEKEACTFHPLLNDHAANSTFNASSVFSRLAESKHTRVQLEGPKFHPEVNHNLDAQLAEWAHGVPAHERLYGESICRKERAAMTVVNHHDGSCHADPLHIESLFERVHRELNSDDVDCRDDLDAPRGHSADIAFRARYLEDPVEKELRLAALRSKYAESFPFKPTISHNIKRPLPQPKRTLRPPSPSEAFLVRLGKDVAREGMLGCRPSVGQPTLSQSPSYRLKAQTKEDRRLREELASTLQSSRKSWSRAKQTCCKREPLTSHSTVVQS